MPDAFGLEPAASDQRPTVSNANSEAERLRILGDLFGRASDLAESDWVRFLQTETADADMQDEVLRLLRLSDSATDFFEELTDQIGAFAEGIGRLEVGHVLSRRFRIERFLARGGMGEVYQAEDLELGGLVAVKIMNAAVASTPGSLERFRAEIRLSRQISEPHVCRVYDVANDIDPLGGELVYFTMELLQGVTLRDRIVARGPFSPAEAKQIVRQMAEGLDAAHKLGILHRDFKSGNVMLCGEGERLRVVITDFGLSRLAGDQGAAGMDGGTAAYSAPEQGKSPQETARTDIYSLGVVLHEMVTGSLPSPDTKTPKLAISALPTAWQGAITRCLERDPARRFESAAEVAHALGCGEERRGWTRRFWIGSTAALVTAAGTWWRFGTSSVSHVNPPSLAVLPFETDDPRASYIADGVADRLVDSLARVPGLRVLARTAAQRLPDSARNFAAAGKRLNVRYLVAGAVRKGAGKKLRIETEVLEASTGFVVWSGTNEISIEELDGLSASVSRALIHALRIDAQPAELGAMERRLTTNPEAYQLYLLGRYHAARRSSDSLRESVRVLESAVKLDPKFAGAFAALAYSYYDLSARDGEDWPSLMGKSMETARKALNLDSNQAEAYLAIGCNQYTWDWNWDAAEASYRKSIALDPSAAEPHRRLATVLSRRARFAEAVKEADRSIDLDPLDTGRKVSRATITFYAGQVDEAIREYRELVSSDPGYEFIYLPMSDALTKKGLLDEAIAACEHAAVATHRASYAISALARLYALAGRRQDAEAILNELRNRFESRHALAAHIAYVYMGLDDRDRAFEWLERAYSQKDSDLILLRVGPEYEFLRSDPRYSDLLRRMRL